MMDSYRSERGDIEFYDGSVREIALHFEIPRGTADSWERNIGDLETLEQTLGRNGPENYLELIRRREWIPHEREELEKEWVDPVKRWCVERVDEIYLVHESEQIDSYNEKHQTGTRLISLGSEWHAVEFGQPPRQVSDNDIDMPRTNWSDEMLELQNEWEQKEDQLKYELKRVDFGWIELTRELREVEKALIAVYESHLNESTKDFQYKKDKIIELKEVFPYLRANHGLVAEVLDTSYSYVAEFKHIPGKELRTDS